MFFSYANRIFCACRVPGFGNWCVVLYKKKRRGILYSCSSHRLAFALPFPRISNASAHAVQFINDHCPQPHGHEQGVINARSERSRCRIFLGSNLRDLMVEDNVRKRPFQNVCPTRPQRGLMSRCEDSTKQVKNKIFLIFSNKRVLSSLRANVRIYFDIHARKAKYLIPMPTDWLACGATSSGSPCYW